MRGKSEVYNRIRAIAFGAFLTAVENGDIKEQPFMSFNEEEQKRSFAIAYLKHKVAPLPPTNKLRSLNKKMRRNSRTRNPSPRNCPRSKTNLNAASAANRRDEQAQ